MKKINKSDFKIYVLATFTAITVAATFTLAVINNKQSSSRDSIIDELNNKFVYMGSDEYLFYFRDSFKNAWFKCY